MELLTKIYNEANSELKELEINQHWTKVQESNQKETGSEDPTTIAVPNQKESKTLNMVHCAL